MNEINDLPPKNDWRAPAWLVPTLAVILGVGAVWSMVALMNERTRASQLDAQNKTLVANLDGVQSQVRILSNQLETLTAGIQAQKQVETREPVAAEQTQRPISIPTAVPNRVARRPKVALKAVPSPTDPRIDEVQARLRQHEKELTDTRQELDKTRQELEGSLNSTKDELNGSLSRTNDSLSRTNDTVARNHDELVELQKRGQRNYYEFTLDKSKQFQRVGPLSLSLRKANTKKRSYDFEMVVDDQKLQKKNVNLYEPVVIMTPDRGQALQLVVNEVSKDVVKGYISEPRFKAPSVNSAAAAPAPTLQQRPE